ncbi:MAG: hypothetical protein AAF065_00325 [Verrucomicrobiota bacterium]
MRKWIYACCLTATSFLLAQDEETQLEPTEPPYEVGALPIEGGYLIEREDAPNLSFRIIENNIRLYWLDDEGLIIEPELDRATVRFRRDARGRDYFLLSRLEDDTALGSPYPVFKPHLHHVFLVLISNEDEDPERHHFRFTPSMSAVADSGEE